MLSLNYIIFGTLPEEQKELLREKLLSDGWKKRQMRQELLLRKEECLLISGSNAELNLAKQLSMATVCYLPPQEDCGQSVWTGFDMYVEDFAEVGLPFLRRVYERHHGLPWTICETERCVIREFSMEYLDALFALYAGKGMTDYIEPLYEYEREREYQQAYIRNMYRFYGYGMWIVCERETGRLIGRAGVEPREELDGELELGYAVGTPYQRQGYAKEVCRAVIAYVKEELEVQRLNCLIEEGNVVSEHLAEKLGFSFTARMKVGGKQMKRYVLALTNLE